MNSNKHGNNTSNALYSKGQKYLDKDDFENAIKYFKQSINSEKESFYKDKSFYGIILSYIVLKEVQKADKYYTQFTECCSVHNYSLTYADIINSYRMHGYVISAFDKINHILHKKTLFQIKIEKAHCFIYFNRLKEANCEIENALTLFQSKENLQFDYNLVECYFIIKNLVGDHLKIVNLYNQMKSKLAVIKSNQDLRRIYLELGIAYINLQQEAALNDEVYQYYNSKQMKDKSRLYRMYLEAYKFSITKQSTQGKNMLKSIMVNIKAYIKNKDIRQNDVFIFYELYGNLCNNLKNNSMEAIENYYKAKYNEPASILRLNLKIAMAFYYNYLDGLFESMYFSDKNISFNKFLKECNSLYQENEQHNHYYNILELKAHHVILTKLKKDKDKMEICFKLFEELTKLLRNDSLRNRYLDSELIIIYEKYFSFLHCYHQKDKNDLELFPQLIGSGRFADVYYGELSKEDVAVKVYKNEKEKFDNKEYYKQALETAIMEITTMELISINKANAPSHLKIGYQFLLPIKCGIFIAGPKLFYLITPLCIGGTLFDLLAKPQIKLSDKEIKQILICIAKAIQVLHWLDMVHKDIRSSNIYLKSQYDKGKTIEVCLGGFDLIKNTSIYNNPFYCTPAPELSKNNDKTGNAIGKEVDIYAFGMLIREMYMKETQYTNFSRTGSARNKRKHVSFDLTRLSHKTSPALYNLFEKCISKDPSKRPTIEQIIIDLNYV